mgnify:CR=1 FL=1
MFISDYENRQYSIQELSTVKAMVTTLDGTCNSHLGLNEIVIKGRHSYSVHLDISIGGMSIERFSGDGILVATSAGSTAYNYSLGGSIVDPRLKLLQVTPIAPMNTTAYRSFTSSILLPSDLSLGVIPEHNDDMIFIVNDGTETEYSNVKKIRRNDLRNLCTAYEIQKLRFLEQSENKISVVFIKQLKGIIIAMTDFIHKVTTCDEGLEIKDIMRNHFDFSSRLRNKIKREKLVMLNGKSDTRMDQTKDRRCDKNYTT